MRRRTRVDLGQQPVSAKEETIINRKRQRWAERNRDKDPAENPFLEAIKPDRECFGEPDERGEELRKRLSNLEFGNFPGYFNYRNKATNPDTNDRATEPSQQDTNDSADDVGQAQANLAPQALDSGLSDERLKFFKAEWFSGKDVLDIGCNRGHITYAISKLFGPKSIVGIDIDLRMINMANRDLHLHLEDDIIGKAREDRRKLAARLRLEGEPSSPEEDAEQQFPLSSYISNGPIAVEKGSDQARSHSLKITNTFPNNIIFIEHNYVLSRDELVGKQKPHFDTIVCLSVTKWIHLNYCDAGLKRFFRRIFKHLRPGGLLILESQPFDNYGRRKKLSDRLRANYYKIQFKPEQFDEYLMSEEVGFRQIVYESVTDHQCAGFKRPLKVFLK